MSVSIKYDDAMIPEINGGQSITLHTNGMKAKTDIVINGSAEILYKGEPLDTLSEGQSMTLHCGGTMLTSDIVVKAIAKTTELLAPSIEATETNGSGGEITITNDPANGDNVVKYAIYEADGTLHSYVDYTGNPQVVRGLSYLVYYYVTAIGIDGSESPKSNLVETAQCFVAGTPVLMADGSYKMIEEIVVGDKVQSYNHETSKYCDGEVTEIVTGYTDRIAMILFEDGNSVAMAEGHPLYTEDGWHSITNKDGYPTLVVGDRVRGAFGYVEITDIKVVDVEPTMVYSLSLANSNCVYFAGAGISVVEANVHSGGGG